jgi:ribose transport system ATP-binding protein
MVEKVLGLSAPQGVGGLSARNLRMTFPGTMALQGVDLDLRPGEVHALLGANGSGKSTLVKILSGYQVPDAGSEVTVSGEPLPLGSPRASYRAGCRFVHQDLALVDDMTVADNVMLTSGWPTRMRAVLRRQSEREVGEALAALGADISPSDLVRTLSPAMRTAVAVARATRRDDDLPGTGIVALVLDEPTANLPQREVGVLARVVREVARQGTAVMIITHHLQEALELADVVTVLRDGQKVLSAPSASLSREAVISAMMGEEYRDQPLGRRALASEEVVLECDRLSGPSLVDVSFRVRRGEVVGIAGLEGSGRDELLPAMYGAQESFGGEVRIKGRPIRANDVRGSIDAGVSYVPADRTRSAVIPEMTGRENLTISDLRACSRGGRIDSRRERKEAIAWFDRVGVRPRRATEVRLNAFSGGNQQKIMLARSMRLHPSVLLLDEPTQGIDVAAQAMLHASLIETAQNEGVAMVVSSSDEEELAAICHRVLLMRRGRIVTELVGDSITPSAIADGTAENEMKSES